MHIFENKKSNWIKTPLSAFGFKCVMNKHDLCDNSSCKCLCHPVNSKNIALENKITTK
jgi:hypothetical protein